MIQSFRSKASATLFKGGRPREFQAIRKVALRKLDMLDAATHLTDLRAPPNNRLEALKGNRKANIRSALTTNGVFVSSGMAVMPTKSKLSITTRSIQS